ncbi:MAG: hypothetical protein DHS20C18_50980 [Saprospiraceae bacterium]|nr:MAG: hypothetical protein DHS20C18_50980 [Saprospiraceae bacterium]
MKGLKKSLLNNTWLRRLIFLPKAEEGELHCWQNFHSAALHRDVKIDIYLPPDYFRHPEQTYPLLVFNDGQDMEAVGLIKRLNTLYRSRKLNPLIIVAIHAGDRMHEYGTSGQLDYKKRGNKAKKYQHFLKGELLPKLRTRYRITTEVSQMAIAGFSLGGLSALDIAWNHPDLFSKVGVFSGALWWRSQPFDPADPDAHRIMHNLLEKSSRQPPLKFWFQTGTHDEKEDRNNNGIIDSIDDTMDLMAILKNKGYSDRDITYLEVPGGEHNPHTWGMVLPEFLIWGFGGES